MVVCDSEGMVIVALSEHITLPPTTQWRTWKHWRARESFPTPLSLGYRMMSLRETLRLYTRTYLGFTLPACLPLVTLLRTRNG